MNELYFVYGVISSVDSRIYVGISQNVEKRLLQHNSGKTKSTKGYKPWELIYVEQVIGRGAARLKEKYYKSGIGKEFLKGLPKNHDPVVQRIEYLPAVKVIKLSVGGDANTRDFLHWRPRQRVYNLT